MRRSGAPRRTGTKRPGVLRRTLRTGWEAEFHPGPVAGPGVTVASPQAVLAALERFDPDRSWPELRDDIRPMLPRLRPMPFPVGEPVRVMLPPGILVAFGLDLGPALAQVGPELLDRWGIGPDELAAVALGNVRRLAAACDRSLIVRNPIGSMDVSALQTRLGIASSLLLVPDTLERFFGREPGLLLAPMRDLLLRLPADTPLVDAAWLSEEFEAIDPNCLHLGGFAWDGSELRPVPLEPASAWA